ncbi:MAG TPA: hypothetical protein ENK28_09520 [Aliiroseovarius sp.]|nr:hypothetical protein [Aliiroseovarius sp.]
MGLIRLVVLGYLGLTVVYFVLTIYFRSLKRESLENEWAEANPGSDDMTARDAFVDAGIAEYKAGILPKMIGLVYVVPTVIVIATLIITNWN